MKKWILMLTMPSGSKFVLGPNPKNKPKENDKTGYGLALFPMQEITKINFEIFSFGSEIDAYKFMRDCAEINDKGRDLMKLVIPVFAELELYN